MISAIKKESISINDPININIDIIDIIINETLLKVVANLSTSLEIRFSLSPEFFFKWNKKLEVSIKFTISNWILLFNEVIIKTLVISIENIKIPFTINKKHKTNNKTDSLGSYPKYFSKSLKNWENLSVPTELDIEIFITGIIIPNPINSIIELKNERVTRKNKPNLDFKKQILKISKKFFINLII